MKAAMAFVLLGVCVLAVGCGKKGDKETPFNRPVTKPLFDSHPKKEIGDDPDKGGNPDKGGDPGKGRGEVLRTDYCYPEDGGPFGDSIKYTDKVNISRGHEGSGDYDWGQGGACVNRSIREVWSVLHTQAAMKWDGVTSLAIYPQSAPEGVTHHYQGDYHVQNGFPLPSVDWQMDWFHSVSAGSYKEPTQIVINYRKVKGTKHISYWEGTIILDFITPTITSVSARDQVNAARTSSEDSAGTVRDVIQRSRTLEGNWNAIGGR